MSFPNDRTYTPDINLQFADGAAAMTATGYTQVGGANALIDLGGNQGASPVQQARIDAVAVVDVTNIKTSSGNESYKLLVVVSNDPNFGAGNVVCAGGVELGAVGGADILNGAASVTGRYEIFFTTNVAGSLYEYAAVYVVIGGTTPTITFDGFIAVLPCM